MGGPSGFTRSRRTFLSLLPTVGGLDAERIVDDLAAQLEGTQRLVDASVRKTSDPARRFEVHCRFIGSAEEARDEAAELLRRALDLPGIELRTRILRDRVTVDFLAWRDGRFHATGRLVAERLAPRAADSATGAARPR